MSANQPTAAWAGPGDPLVVVAGHLVSPQDGFGEIGRMPNGNLRRPNRMAIGTGGIESIGGLSDIGFGVSAFLRLNRANGTEALPTAVLSGNVLGSLRFRGHDGVAFVTGARIDAFAAENWAVGAHGTNLDFQTVPIGSAVMTDRWRMLAAGHLVTATDNVVDIGASGANRPRDIHIARDALVGNEVEVDVIRERTAATGVTIDGLLIRDAIVQATDKASGGSNVVWAAVTADAFRRYELHADGGMEWGSGAASRDVFLRRAAAGELQTDDDFIIGALSATAISVGVNDSGGVGFKLLRVPN